ncbi:hypothetical protein QQ045_000786 [Rhodiola kirilowii]
MERSNLCSVEESKKIVVAVDESNESMYNTLVLLYVKPSPPLHSPLDAAGYMFSRDVVGAVEKYGNELVNSVMERADNVYRNLVSDNIKVKKKVGTGEAKDVICETVKNMRADVLVVLTGSSSSALLGSVSDYCAKNAKCPVVVVKRPEMS